MSNSQEHEGQDLNSLLARLGTSDSEARTRFNRYYQYIYESPKLNIGERDALLKWMRFNAKTQDRIDTAIQDHEDEGLVPPPPPSEDDFIAEDLEVSDGNKRTWEFAEVLYPTERSTGQIWPPKRSVSLYVVADKHGNIIDRIVAKRCEVSESDHEQLDLEGRMHAQVHVLRSPHILGLRFWNRRGQDDGDLFLLYTEFAPSGDLETLADMYRQRRKHIPELYLWIIFDAVAEALYILRTGSRARFDERGELVDHEPKVGWDPIVHHDLKPQNILLGSPTPPFLGYMTPQMADFGLAAYITRDMDHDTIRGGGTPGWMPPEFCYYPSYFDKYNRNRDTYAGGATKWAINDKSDIWALGLTIWELMRVGSVSRTDLADLRGSLDFDVRGRNNPYAEYFEEFVASYDGMYTATLEDLVYECVRFKQEDRPGIFEVRERTRKALRKAQKAFGSAEVGDAAQLMEHLKVEFQEEMFKIGTAGPGKKRKALDRLVLDGEESEEGVVGVTGGDGGDDGDGGDGDANKRRKTGEKPRYDTPVEPPARGPAANEGNIDRPLSGEVDGAVDGAPQDASDAERRPAGLRQEPEPAKGAGNNENALPSYKKIAEADRSAFLWWVGHFKNEDYAEEDKPKDPKWWTGKRWKLLVEKWRDKDDDQKRKYRAWAAQPATPPTNNGGDQGPEAS